MAISSLYFFDNKEREFALYKGWMIIEPNGEMTKDEQTISIKGSLQTIPDPLSHKNYHTLENLIGLNGEKILPKGVRHIRYYPEGYYIVEDDNEDELINSSKRGDFSASDIVKKMNIISERGEILSDLWFDDVQRMVNGYFLVSRDGEANLIDINGNMFLKNYERNLRNVIKGVAYSYHDELLYANSQSEQPMVKRLRPLSDNQTYKIMSRLTFDNLRFRYASGRIIKDTFSPIKSQDWLYRICREDDEYMNIVNLEGCLIFDNWYQKVTFSGISGIYLVKDSGQWAIVDLGENSLSDVDFVPIFKYSYNYQMFVRLNDYDCGIIDSQGKVICRGFTSAIYRGPERDGYVYHNNNTFIFDYKRGNINIVRYALDILVSKQRGLFVERDDIWYLVEQDGSMAPYFKASPKEITKNLEICYLDLL